VEVIFYILEKTLEKFMRKFVILLGLFLISCGENYHGYKYVDRPVIIVISDDNQLEALYRLAEEGLKVCNTYDADTERELRKCARRYLGQLEELKNSFNPDNPDSISDEKSTNTPSYKEEY